MDPISIISVISGALGLVDKFVSIVRTVRHEPPKPFSVEAKQEGGALVISHDGIPNETVPAKQLNLNMWDSTRFQSLQRVVEIQWKLYNGYNEKRLLAGYAEQVQLEVLMEEQQKDLCKNFKEMISISEKVLGVSLGDHYSLYSCCGNGN